MLLRRSSCRFGQFFRIDVEVVPEEAIGSYRRLSSRSRRAEGGDLEVRVSPPVGRRIRRHICDRAAGRSDLEPVGRSRVEQSRRRSRELQREVPRKPAVRQRLACAMLNFTAPKGTEDVVVGHDRHLRIDERGDLGDGLQVFYYGVGVVRAADEDRLRDLSTGLSLPKDYLAGHSSVCGLDG